MERATLTVSLREQTGKGAAHKLRAAGMIPAVLYGPEQDSLKLQINPRNLHQSLKAGGGRYTLLTLEVEGEDTKGISGKFALIRDVQYHPFRTQITHMDLYLVPLGRKIDMVIPLTFTGQPLSLGKDYVFQELIREVTLRCEVTQLPSLIDVNIDGITVGHKIYVRDLNIPANVEILNDPNELVAIMTGKTATLEEKPKVVEGEAEEAAEAEPEKPKKGEAKAEKKA